MLLTLKILLHQWNEIKQNKISNHFVLDSCVYIIDLSLNAIGISKVPHHDMRKVLPIHQFLPVYEPNPPDLCAIFVLT